MNSWYAGADGIYVFNFNPPENWEPLPDSMTKLRQLGSPETLKGLDKIYGVARWAKCPEARRIGTWNFGKLDRIYLSELFPRINEVDVNLLGVYNRRVGPSLDPAELVAVVAVVAHYM